MKKLFLLALGAMVLASCSSNNSNSESQADSTAVQADVPQAPETPAAPKVTDCPAFLLTGNVKSCVTKTNHITDDWVETKTYNFDKDGKFVSVIGFDTLVVGSDNYRAERKDGRISKIIKHVFDEDFDVETELEYGSDNRITKLNEQLLEGRCITTYTYSDDAMTVIEEAAAEGMCSKETTTYKYDAKDDHGNWTKATASGTRAEWSDGEDEAKAAITKVKSTVERTITYW